MVFDLVAVADPLLSSGNRVPSIHEKEYAYADHMKFITEYKKAYTQEREASNEARLNNYHTQKEQFLRRVHVIEDRYGCCAREYRKEHGLEFRHMVDRASFLDEEEKKTHDRDFVAALVLLGDPPSRPIPRSTPFLLALWLTRPDIFTEVMHHSAVVSAFLTGKPGWHLLYFSEKMECFGENLPSLVRLEAVREMLVATYTWYGYARPPLPSVKTFIDMYDDVRFN